MIQTKKCWCGNNILENFGTHYMRCTVCESLVYVDEASGLSSPGIDRYYGQNYWFSHQVEVLNLPDITKRVRTDLVDRHPYWLKEILRYRFPPANVLEIGSSHGGFVHLLELAGYSAMGLEIDPNIVEYSINTHGIRVLTGEIERQNLPPESLDIMIMFDVLEHLPDPLSTINACTRLLKSDGLLFVQTPCYPEGKTYEELSSEQSPFIKMLIPFEHLYLFSQHSVKELLSRFGFSDLNFLPPRFPQYDMFFVASRGTLKDNSDEEVTTFLKSFPQGNILLGLLDLFSQNQDLTVRLQESEADRNNRLASIQQLERLLQESEADRNNRLASIQQLERLLQESEADRNNRLASIQQLERLLQESEADRNNRLASIQQLERLLQESEADRDLQLEIIHSLEQKVHTTSEKLQLLTKTIQVLQNRNIYHLVKHFKPFKEFQQSIQKIEAAEDKRLKRIVIDLTPVRPGGENGGAKLLALELIKQFSQNIAPDRDYILLTASDSHDELAIMERSNVRRLCVNFDRNPNSNGPQVNPAARQKPALRRLLGKLADRFLPRSIHRKLYTLYRSRAQKIQSNSLLEELQADVVFCPFTAPLYYDPTIPIVLVVHDLQYKYYPLFHKIEDIYHTDRYFQQACKVASRLICVSNYTRQTVLEEALIDPARVCTILTSLYNPIQRNAQEQVEQHLAKFDLQNKNYMLYPANFWPHKNHKMLLAAFAGYLTKNPNSKIHMVFTGAPGQKMTELIYASEKMGIDKRVHFLGYVQADEFSSLLQSSRALIFPSLFEGFGVPILEAMSFGIPVFCSNVTSLPEVGGDAVSYFDPRDAKDIQKAIETIELNSDLLLELSKKGLNRSLAFDTPTEWARKYFRVLEQAVLNSKHFTSSIQGVYPDNWLGEKAVIYIQPNQEIREVQLTLTAPAWLPDRTLICQFIENSSNRVSEYTIERGQTKILHHLIKQDTGNIQIRFPVTYQPKALGLNEDERRLSCMIDNCVLISPTKMISVYEKS